jgi:hypothetical protein
MAFVVALGMSKTPRVGDNTHPLDEDRTREVLREQLGFLKSPANAYNQGNTSEAKRLATTARTLATLVSRCQFSSSSGERRSSSSGTPDSLSRAARPGGRRPSDR